MENKFIKKFLKGFLFIFSILIALQLIACEDDAILEPQSSDDCQGSYCNLSLSKKYDYVCSNINNPEIY